MSFSTPSSPASPTSSVSPSAAPWGGRKEWWLCLQWVSIEFDLLILVFTQLKPNIREQHQRAAPCRLLWIMRCYQNTKQCWERRVARGRRSQSGDVHPHARHKLNIISGGETSSRLFELIALTRSQHIWSRKLFSSAAVRGRLHFI